MSAAHVFLGLRRFPVSLSTSVSGWAGEPASIGRACPSRARKPRFFFLTRGLRLRTLGLVVGAMLSVHGTEIDELMVDTVVKCDSHINSIEEGVLAALRSDCHSMLFLELKPFKIFDTSAVYGQSRSGTVAVELWHCG